MESEQTIQPEKRNALICSLEFSEIATKYPEIIPMLNDASNKQLLTNIITALYKDGIRDEYARDIYFAFNLLIESKIFDKNAYLAVSQYIEDVSLALDNLNKAKIEDNNIDFGICQNPQYAYEIAFAFNLLIKANISNKNIYAAVCLYIEDIALALDNLDDAGIKDTDIYLSIYKNAQYAEDIANLFIYLKQIGIFPELYSKSNCNAILDQNAYIEDIKFLFEFAIKFDLFKPPGYYNIVLMHNLPEKDNLRNIIVITKKPESLCQFDQDGNKTEILIDGRLKLNFKHEEHYIKLKGLIETIEPGKKICINDNLKLETLIQIYRLVELHGGQRQSYHDNRQLNSELICKAAEYAADILDLLNFLSGIGLISQSIFIAALKNGKHAELINTIFRTLDKLKILNKSNYQHVFQHAKYAPDVVNTLIFLEKNCNYINLFTKDNVSAICQYPKYIYNTVSILIYLKKSSPDLVSEKNMQTICKHIKYSAGISAACHSLSLDDNKKLTQKIFELICEDPKHAIYIAIEHGGKYDKENCSLEEFVNVRKAAGILAQMKRGWESDHPENPLPLEIIKRLLPTPDKKHLDPETRSDIFKNSFYR